MVEIWAAVIGAAIGVGAGSFSGLMRRDSEASTGVARLPAATEHIAKEVSLLRTEIRDDRSELYPRLNNLEQRLSVLEGRLS